MSDLKSEINWDTRRISGSQDIDKIIYRVICDWNYLNVCYNIPKLSIELKKKDELNVGFYLYESILNQLIINLITD